MIGLASSFSAASLSALSARATSSSSSSISNTLPWRTLATPAMPSALSAPSIALPWGSSTPDFRVTVTRARNVISACRHPRWGESDRGPRGPRMSSVCTRSTLHQDRPHALRALALAHDAEPLGDFGIGLEQNAEIAAEAILVEL